MRMFSAYIAVVLLWSTTPLAIKWSGEGPGYLFGVTSRMVIGAACVGLGMLLLRQRPAWHRRARLTYLAVALQIYGSMLAVYWAAQFIPSGWISVLFGLTPLITALLAAACLGENSLTFGRLLAYGLGAAGLYVMLASAMEFGQQAALATGGVLVSAILQAVAAVLIKRIDADIPALSQVGGGLALALPAYLLTWVMADGRWPVYLPTVSLVAIVYLGVIATGIGFVLYYYVLQRLPATRVALITLVTPVLAIMLGHAANHEPFTPRIILGAALILGALVLHEFPARFSVKPGENTPTTR